MSNEQPKMILLSEEGIVIMQEVQRLSEQITETNALIIKLMNDIYEDEDEDEDEQHIIPIKCPMEPSISDNLYSLMDVV